MEGLRDSAHVSLFFRGPFSPAPFDTRGWILHELVSLHEVLSGSLPFNGHGPRCGCSSWSCCCSWVLLVGVDTTAVLWLLLLLLRGRCVLPSTSFLLSMSRTAAAVTVGAAPGPCAAAAACATTLAKMLGIALWWTQGRNERKDEMSVRG